MEASHAPRPSSVRLPTPQFTVSIPLYRPQSRRSTSVSSSSSSKPILPPTVPSTAPSPVPIGNTLSTPHTPDILIHLQDYTLNGVSKLATAEQCESSHVSFELGLLSQGMIITMMEERQDQPGGAISRMIEQLRSNIEEIRSVELEISKGYDSVTRPADPPAITITFKLGDNSAHDPAAIVCTVNSHHVSYLDSHFLESKVKARLERWGFETGITIEMKETTTAPSKEAPDEPNTMPSFFEPINPNSWNRAFPPHDSAEWQAHIVEKKRRAEAALELETAQAIEDRARSHYRSTNHDPSDVGILRRGKRTKSSKGKYDQEISSDLTDPLSFSDDEEDDRQVASKKRANYKMYTHGKESSPRKHRRSPSLGMEMGSPNKSIRNGKYAVPSLDLDPVIQELKRTIERLQQKIEEQARRNDEQDKEIGRLRQLLHRIGSNRLGKDEQDRQQSRERTLEGKKPDSEDSAPGADDEAVDTILRPRIEISV